METKRYKLEGGKKVEKNACTVVALAVSANIPYEKAYEIAQQAGRQKYKGFVSKKLIKFFNKQHKQLSFKLIKRSSITVQKFCKQFPKGRYYIRKSKHAFAIVDGVVWDVDAPPPSPRERILHAWRFEEIKTNTVENSSK